MHELALTLQGRERFDAVPAPSTLRRWVHAALDRDAQLTLRFVDAREGRRLNRDFRGRDYATDVLTFAYSRRPAACADIVICPSVVARAARARGQPPRAHYAHLVVHATLHALGHDHVKTAGARRMEAREIAILAALGYDDPYRL
ncbi:MAG TPA: rRNA maturation RNase YbeY [Burkholderiaceae bacterium]|nr:rRNA maturation RNase YbeY [Burkholderiaceae bacterium]